MGQLDGLVAVVTGGARGLGAAICEVMVREGATIVAGDIRPEDGKELLNRLSPANLRYVDLDVTDEHAWQQVVDAVLEEFGQLDILVNNAGVVSFLPLMQTPLEEYQRIIAVNQTGVFLGMRAVLPAMVQARRGTIVNVSSVDGIRGMPGTAPYSASKHAVIGLTRSAALEVAAFGVRVVAVCPGVIETPMAFESDLSALGDVNVNDIVAKLPFGRPAKPREVAEFVAFLASDRGSYCTGSGVVVDGGWTAGLPL